MLFQQSCTHKTVPPRPHDHGRVSVAENRFYAPHIQYAWLTHADRFVLQNLRRLAESKYIYVER